MEPIPGSPPGHMWPTQTSYCSHAEHCAALLTIGPCPTFEREPMTALEARKADREHRDSRRYWVAGTFSNLVLRNLLGAPTWTVAQHGDCFGASAGIPILQVPQTDDPLYLIGDLEACTEPPTAECCNVELLTHLALEGTFDPENENRFLVGQACVMP